MLAELFNAVLVVAIAYISRERRSREIGHFSDDEDRHTIRRYVLKNIYDGSELTCYDELHLTERTFCMWEVWAA